MILPILMFAFVLGLLLIILIAILGGAAVGGVVGGAAGAIGSSREIPSFFRGLRLSKLFGRRGVITFESNGLFIVARGERGPRLVWPGYRDIRGYQAMYRDFVQSIWSGRQPEMSLERAREDQRLMDLIYMGSETTAQ